MQNLSRLSFLTIRLLYYTTVFPGFCDCIIDICNCISKLRNVYTQLQ